MNVCRAPTDALQCQELQAAVVACYQANPARTLDCSLLVKDFVACAEKARLVRRPGGWCSLFGDTLTPRRPQEALKARRS